MDIYRLSIDEIKQLDTSFLGDVMPERMKKSERYKYEKDRLLCIGGGYMIWKVLGLDDEKKLRENEHGKPYSTSYPDFNVSHSGDCVVFAMANGSEAGSVIGVDIEIIKERNTNVSRKVFTAKEQEWMEEDPLKRFHILWTRKESVMKALGKGFSLPFTSFEVVSEKTSGETRDITTVMGQKLYMESMVADDYIISVCSSSPIDSLTVKSPL